MILKYYGHTLIYYDTVIVIFNIIIIIRDEEFSLIPNVSKDLCTKTNWLKYLTNSVDKKSMNLVAHGSIIKYLLRACKEWKVFGEIQLVPEANDCYIFFVDARSVKGLR